MNVYERKYFNVEKSYAFICVDVRLKNRKQTDQENS